MTDDLREQRMAPTIEVHRHAHGGIQLSINRSDGSGGFRIAGPKFCGCCESKLLLRHELSDRDMSEIRLYLMDEGWVDG